jgi:hypothetical protein
MNLSVSKILFIALILCLFKDSKATESVDISRDFKILLMYFSEAFLKGAVFDGLSLEGEIPTAVAENIVDAINTVEVEHPKLPDLEGLTLFKKQLEDGIPIAEEIRNSKSDGDPSTLETEAVSVQTKFLEALEKNDGVIMPIGWIGHALYMVLRKRKDETKFDLAVINTGQGLEFHLHSSDPNNIYPRLSGIWLEFQGIEADELFSNDAWFFQGLIALGKEFFLKRLQKEFDGLDYLTKTKSSHPFPEYFYGSFLANFRKYFVSSRHRFVPMQRSGSCALSSLIGALLYTSNTEDTFHLHRLKIGHTLIESFLTKAASNEKFKKLISDGFGASGRNFFKGIGSSLAQKTLEYLEFVLPDYFKHAGLIGSERFKWIFEKREAANKALLEANPIVLKSIKTSVELINRIMNFLKENTFSIASNDIILTDELRTQYEAIQVDYSPSPTESRGNQLSKDFNSFLKGTCDRPEEPLGSFKDFFDALVQFKNLQSADDQDSVFYRVLNVFQRAQLYGKDHYWLEDGTKEQILNLQDICKNVAWSFSTFEKSFLSFDHIVLLAFLQTLSWKLAVAYDRKSEYNRIGIESLGAPQTLQSVHFRASTGINVFSGQFKSWMTKNIFDQKNFEIFLELLKQDEAEDYKTRFLGPEHFCSVDTKEFYPLIPDQNREIYLKMMENPEVEDIFQSLVSNNEPKNLWIKADRPSGKFIIVLSKGRTRLFQHFPHYYNLMDTLELVRSGSILADCGTSWTVDNISSVTSSPEEVVSSISQGVSPINRQCFNSICYASLIQDHSPFFAARHSLALNENIDITSLETWFNYIKSSSSAKLFDSPYFQYITDHLLNVPKLGWNKKVFFPVDELTAKSIIEELSRLIWVSLEAIKVDQELPRSTLVIRSVNISVILTRFISRIDSENILTGSECAKSLAHIYNSFIPLARFKTEYFLSESEISRINFALGHICTVSIRNALTFMDNVNLETSQKGLKKTLKRYHWFAAKKAYISSGSGTIVADDQFNYGRSESSMTAEETPFLKELIAAYFLPVLITDQIDLSSNDYNFRYNYECSLVNILDTIKGLDITINLWSGAVVFNGLCMINNNIFINSKEFQKHFAPEDLPLVSNGIAAEAGGILIYAVPDFKGSSYLISREFKRSKFFWQKSEELIQIRRKWNGNWYTLTNSFEALNFEYDWIKKHSRIFKRDFGQKSWEIIVILNNDINPVIRFIGDEVTSTIKVAVDGFIDRSDWTVVFLHEQNNRMKFQRNFDSFTRGVYILAKDDCDRFVVICMNFRLPEDMRRPVVFKEKEKTIGSLASEFEILNMPTTEICSNQSFGGGKSLPGGLVIISGSKKSLIIASASKKEASSTIIRIDKIPILDDSPAPQSREHKLLLAYHLILQFEFDSARKLLSPYTSIHHNEMFSSEEITILKWIMEVELEAPEALALKLFAFLHYRINLEKFSLSYSVNESMPFPDTQAYLFAIREMSEKYYVFLTFPEFLKEPLFSKLFSFFKVPTYDNDNYYYNYKSWHDKSLIPSRTLSNSNDCGFDSYCIGTGGNFSKFINLVRSKNDDQLKLISRLMLRRVNRISFDDSAEMAIFCYIKAPNMWTEFLSTYKGYMDNYQKVLNDCKKVYNEDFMGVYRYYYEFRNTNTSNTLKNFKATLEAEVSNVRLNLLNDNFKSDALPDLVSPLDIETISGVETNLRNLLKSGCGTRSLANFDSEIVKNSIVLARLEKSIKDFANESDHGTQAEVKLNDIFGTLHDIEVFLFDRFNDLSSSQKKYAAYLNAMINSDTLSSTVGSILNLMHQKKVKTFESFYSCYFKDSLVCIQKKFPQLSLEQCRQVMEKAKVFYSRQVLINYFGMLESNVEYFLELAKNNETISVDDLNMFCDELSKIKDFNSRMKDPVIMNFEFRSQKFRLKPEQVKDVELLTTKDVNSLFPSIVIQRMMAAGKTLVLGTISVVKKALDSTQLSILVPPSSLYQSNTTAMQNRTYQYFKKRGINFTFSRFGQLEDRELCSDLISYLSYVIETITNAMNEGNYLILSPDMLHSFLNSYIEVLLKAENKWEKDQKLVLTRYAEIYRIFKQRGSIILDEIDMTMDPKKELNFPTLETEPYNMTAVAMLVDIMEFMIFDKEIIDSGLSIHSNNQASLTERGYQNCIKIILKYIENQLLDSSSLWNHLIYGFSKSDETSASEIIEFLQDPNMVGRKEWITELHNSGSETIANALIIVKQQLHYQLKHALMGTVNHNFGSAGSLRPEIKFAVPYAAANTPSAASVFADRWETLIKTLLMISASTCGLEIAKDFMEYARMSISEESAITQSLKNTVTYKHLKLILPENLCPLSLDSRNVFHIQAIQQALATRSPAAIRLIFTFYISQVFDKMTFPTEQITSNALNVASMFNSVQGYSGTIDNINILPQHVVKDAFEDNLRNEKNNGGISLKLINDCNDGIVKELSEIVFTKSAVEMVKDLLSLYPSDEVSAIIDAGAFFKNFKNNQVARAILSVCDRIKAVLYYDEDSNQLEFLRSNGGSYTGGVLETSDPDDITRSTQVEIDSRFTFYDQRHITGSDILQPKTAHALLTAGPRVLLRDILQGTLRMRQFMTSQVVHLVTTEASRKFYCSKIMQEKTEMRVSDVLALGALNEDDKQEHENVKLAFGKIDADIRAFVLDEISRTLLLPENPEDTKNWIFIDGREFKNTSNLVSGLIKSGKPLFLRSIKEVPLDWLQESKDENASDILKIYAISRLHPLKKIMVNFSSDLELQQRFNSLKKRIKIMISPENKEYYFSKALINSPIKLDDGCEVQQQQQLQTLTINELNMDQLVRNNLSPGNQHAIRHDHKLLYNLESATNSESLLSCDDYLSLKDLYNNNLANIPQKSYIKDILITLGNQIGVTQDLIKILEPYSSYCQEFPIFSEYTFEGSHILVQIFGDNLKVLLISPKEASKVFEQLHKNYHKITITSKYWLCDLSGSVTATNDSETERGENVLEFIPQIDNLIFDLLTFNGALPQILANHKLKAIYANWLKSTNFTNRAIFLRLRMKFLMGKEKEIFELNDQNLICLKRLSLGIKNSADGVIDGYPKSSIISDFEEMKKKLLNINSITQKSFDSEKKQSYNPIDFNFNTEIKELFKVNEGESNTNTDPDFVYGPVENLTVHDYNLDEREPPIKTTRKRSIIKVAEYPMANQQVYEIQIKEETPAKEVELQEILDTEIQVDDSLEEYREPALTEFEPLKMTEISVDLGSKSEQTHYRRLLQSSKDYFHHLKHRLSSINDRKEEDSQSET